MDDTETTRETSIDQQDGTNTPYDDVFRTINEDCPRLIIPLINEIFSTDYPLDTKIEFLSDKHIINLPGRKQIKRETDSNISITHEEEDARFHVESQSTYDVDISKRIYEYDSHIALENGASIGNVLHVKHPYSAVLYLRSKKNTPDKFYISIETPFGDITYPVFIIKLKKYDLDEIFEKKLWFLIPFYLFKYEDEFDAYENNEDLRRELRAELCEIVNRLEQLNLSGVITAKENMALTDTFVMVAEHLASDYKNVISEVKGIMGGKVLEYRSKTIWNEGKSEGIKEGKSEGIMESIRNLMSSLKFTAEQAMDALQIPGEDRETYLSMLSK